MSYLVYLAGPITGLDYKGSVGWREFVAEKLYGTEIKTLSPMRGKDFLATVGPIGDAYEESILATSKAINTRDYNDVRRCDAILVNFLGATRVSIGTVMEIAWARAFNKPVVLVMEEGNIHTHAMLQYACGYEVKTLEDGITTLQALLLPDQVVKEPRTVNDLFATEIQKSLPKWMQS